MEEECEIEVFIYIWKSNTILMTVITFGRVISDRCLYSHLKVECQKNVFIYIWKRNAR